jgi:hypothetical protein
MIGSLTWQEKRGLSNKGKSDGHADINIDDWVVQATFAEHLEKALGGTGDYACTDETFAPDGTLRQDVMRNTVLKRGLLLSRLMSGEVAV